MSTATNPQFSDSDFKKSSYCTYPPGGCVEVAMQDGVVAVRDGQNPERIVFFTAADWQKFVKGIKNGEFDFGG